ncbi:hypothetical protein V5O48_004167 [Marasmius crinis-equi]|uniref:RRM domain-containing protein n=1 Tax=Marasmius crinis-equi TaxID=585013 RepID=A0ABR3FQT6_9AGAR
MTGWIDHRNIGHIPDVFVKDAEDAVQNFNGKNFMGSGLVVQFAKEGRPRRDHYEDRREYNARSRRPPGIRIIVSGISRDTSWQAALSPRRRSGCLDRDTLWWSFPGCPRTYDLKDFGRDAGSVSFADIDRDVPGQGILEYPSRDDAERAIKQLDNTDLRGRPVRVTFDDSRSGPDNYRRDDRRDDRYGRDDRHRERDDRYRDDRYREDRYRRDRSKSPRRGDYDERRRSPPPRRGEDDRRLSGYEDRRGGDDDRRKPDLYDRRRDEERRHDRRRDEKDDRYDERPRHANGDSAYR